MRARLSTSRREKLYADEAQKAHDLGLGPYPICNLCQEPILPGRLWDASHDPQIPNWLRPREPEALAHRRCNRIWNNQHDTPLFAKSERQRKGFLDLKRSSTPLPGGREDRIKKTMSGKVVDRLTGQPWGSR